MRPGAIIANARDDSDTFKKICTRCNQKLADTTRTGINKLKQEIAESYAAGEWGKFSDLPNPIADRTAKLSSVGLANSFW
jgi:hypothetical protein